MVVVAGAAALTAAADVRVLSAGAVACRRPVPDRKYHAATTISRSTITSQSHPVPRFFTCSTRISAIALSPQNLRKPFPPDPAATAETARAAPEG
jgi:hypothetical protein